ncbi:probable xyloglucan endotransglucosylase/hydrolase protein 12 [Asparagus officinalis]|uniref:probable xyloglucan endotransglucosylase/hydrolase protein 12 n=1 Tax=Asparagus officinalis TaxID=4686 RepID=UPI00098E62D4|nr:probable xyloglucan endotransglucosylase/hydrolase protein 12 [Asparagus officinalis]
MTTHFLLLRAFFLTVFLVSGISAQSFTNDVDVSGNANVQEDGNQLQLSLDSAGGSEAISKQEYLYGRFDMQIKAIPGYSAGTVTSYFLQSPRPSNDEIDFELLGNVTGQPYLLHTNLWTSGQGNREQQMNLWFDPTADFHNYTFVWNPHNIIWLVDGIPVRVYRNAQQQGIPYLSSQRLRVRAALWNGEEWATRRGRVKIDWSQAPFVAYFCGYRTDACSDGSQCSESRGQWWDWTLDEAQAEKLRWVRENYMVRDYCQEQGAPECSVNNP